MKITPYRIKKGVLYLKHYGPKAFWNRLKDKMESERVPYGPWFERHKAGSIELRQQAKLSRKLEKPPVFSIVVPCYNPNLDYFFELMTSLHEQSYGYWQLCLADASTSSRVEDLARNFRFIYDETRIYYIRLRENGGIAENTNSGMDLAKGDWIGFMDHDDLLAPNALYELAMAVIQDKEIEAIYTDEDQVEEKKDREMIHQKPHFKPDYSPDLLRSNNYITHFFCVKGDLLDRVGGFRKEFDGAQDYDFILRCTEAAKKVHHIPKVLYHWRIHSGSTADNPMSKSYAYKAGKRAVEAQLARAGERGKVSQLPHFGFYRVKYAVTGAPLVSILIPNKDQAGVLRRCMASLQKSSYQNYEVILVENNSTGQEIFSYYQELAGKPLEQGKTLLGQGSLPGGQAVKILRWEKGFNYSAINNFAASHASGEYLILLNNDIEIITKDWIEEMLGNCQRPGVGIVGARLYYPNNTIQHAGIVVGIDGIAANMFPGLKRGQEGYYHKAALQLNYSAVTAACLMVPKEIYEKVHGLEEKLAVAFNDLDFSLRVREEGYLVVYNPFVEAYHHESKSRGQEDTKEKVRRFGEEIEFVRSRWMQLIQKGDPYYNPNLSLKKCNYSLRR